MPLKSTRHRRTGTPLDKEVKDGAIIAANGESAEWSGDGQRQERKRKAAQARVFYQNLTKTVKTRSANLDPTKNRI